MKQKELHTQRCGKRCFMNMKRSVSLLLAILMLGGALSACNPSEEPVSTDTQTVTDTAEPTAPETVASDTAASDTEATPTETEGETVPANAVLLIDEGKSDYVIVVSEQSEISERKAEMTAAGELQAYIAAMTGVTLPIRKDTEGEPIATEIVVGNTNRANAGSYANDDAFRIHLEGQRLYICGGSPRGTLYAAYHLLETMGCRFFAVDVETVPRLETLYLDEATDIQEVPAFTYRDVYWSCAYDATLSTKLKINGSVSKGVGRRLGWEEGVGIHYAGPTFCHTFQFIIPASTFTEHPEYFSEINGVRTNASLYSQLCLTNPDVLAITIETVKGWLRSEPAATMVSVSQNDDFGNTYCTCASCSAINEEEGSPAGTLIRFINAVADAIAEEFPHVFVETLAYHDTEVPPKLTKARDNVVVRFCATAGCCSHAVSDCENNAVIREVIQGWKEVCPRLYVWEYTSEYQHYLFSKPNFAALQGTIQYYYENDVIGMFAQGIYNEELYNGEFGELRAYLLAKLLWDPYADVETLTEEFMTAFYGDAASYVKDYIDWVQTLVVDEHLTVFNDPLFYAEHLTDEAVAYCDGLWSRAREAVADDELRSLRVERSELQYRYIKYKTRKGLPYHQNRYKKELLLDCIRLGITHFNEAQLINSSW